MSCDYINYWELTSFDNTFLPFGVNEYSISSSICTNQIVNDTATSSVFYCGDINNTNTITHKQFSSHDCLDQNLVNTTIITQDDNPSIQIHCTSNSNINTTIIDNDDHLPNSTCGILLTLTKLPLISNSSINSIAIDGCMQQDYDYNYNSTTTLEVFQYPIMPETCINVADGVESKGVVITTNYQSVGYSVDFDTDYYLSRSIFDDYNCSGTLLSSMKYYNNSCVTMTDIMDGVIDWNLNYSSSSDIGIGISNNNDDDDNDDEVLYLIQINWHPEIYNTYIINGNRNKGRGNGNGAVNSDQVSAVFLIILSIMGLIFVCGLILGSFSKHKRYILAKVNKLFDWIVIIITIIDVVNHFIVSNHLNQLSNDKIIEPTWRTLVNTILVIVFIGYCGLLVCIVT